MGGIRMAAYALFLADPLKYLENAVRSPYPGQEPPLPRGGPPL